MKVLIESNLFLKNNSVECKLHYYKISALLSLFHPQLWFGPYDMIITPKKRKNRWAIFFNKTLDLKNKVPCIFLENFIFNKNLYLEDQVPCFFLIKYRVWIFWTKLYIKNKVPCIFLENFIVNKTLYPKYKVPCIFLTKL